MFKNRSAIHFDLFESIFAIDFSFSFIPSYPSSGQRWGFGRHLAAAVCAMVLAEDVDQVSDLAPCRWSKVATAGGRTWKVERF